MKSDISDSGVHKALPDNLYESTGDVTISEPAQLQQVVKAPESNWRKGRNGVHSFSADWGPQAWIEMFMANAVMVQPLSPLLRYSFLPLLRLRREASALDKEYEALLAQRELSVWYDSPREKWRKRYGNLVRELEWALLTLKPLLSEEQYKQQVISTCAGVIAESSQRWQKRWHKLFVVGHFILPKAWQQTLINWTSPTGFWTGPMLLSRYSPEQGKVDISVPKCAWHSCGKRSQLPLNSKLPEQGCALVCKASLEHIFNSSNGKTKVTLHPNLGKRSCAIKLRWQTEDV